MDYLGLRTRQGKEMKSLSQVRLCDPMDCSPPGSSVHGILQARILEWLPFLLQGIFPTQGLNPNLLQTLNPPGKT